MFLRDKSFVFLFQSKPMVPLQSDFDHGTQSHVLTCFMFPQQPPADEGRIWAILDFWCWTRPEPSIPATGQKDRGLWGQEWFYSNRLDLLLFLISIKLSSFKTSLHFHSFNFYFFSSFRTIQWGFGRQHSSLATWRTNQAKIFHCVQHWWRWLFGKWVLKWRSFNFCRESKVIRTSNANDRAWPHFKTLRREFKIWCVVEYFWWTLRCLEIWSNTVLSVYISSQWKLKLKRKQRNKIVKIQVN